MAGESRQRFDTSQSGTRTVDRSFYAGLTVKISSRSHPGPFISERYDWFQVKGRNEGRFGALTLTVVFGVAG